MNAFGWGTLPRAPGVEQEDIAHGRSVFQQWSVLKALSGGLKAPGTTHSEMRICLFSATGAAGAQRRKPWEEGTKPESLSPRERAGWGHPLSLLPLRLSRRKMRTKGYFSPVGVPWESKDQTYENHPRLHCRLGPDRPPERMFQHGKAPGALGSFVDERFESLLPETHAGLGHLRFDPLQPGR